MSKDQQALVSYTPLDVAVSRVGQTPFPPQGLLARAKRRLAGERSDQRRVARQSGQTRAVAVSNRLEQKTIQLPHPLSGLANPLVVLPMTGRLVTPKQAESVHPGSSRQVIGPERSRRARTISKVGGQVGFWTDLFGIRRKELRTAQAELVQVEVVRSQKPRETPEVQRIASRPESFLGRIDRLFTPFGSRKLAPIAATADVVHERIPRQVRTDKNTGNERARRPISLVSVQPRGGQPESRTVVPVGQKRRAKPTLVVTQVVEKGQKRPGFLGRVFGAVDRFLNSTPPRSKETKELIRLARKKRPYVARRHVMAGVATTGFLAACAPRTVVVEKQAPATAVPTNTPKPKETLETFGREATVTAVVKKAEEAVATATKVFTAAPEDPRKRATAEAVRQAEAKEALLPQIKWSKESLDSGIEDPFHPARESIDDQVLALRYAVSDWAKRFWGEGEEEKGKIVGVGNDFVASGLELVTFDQGSDQVLAALSVTEEIGDYGKGTLLLALDTGQSLTHNTLKPVGLDKAKEEGFLVDPTFIKADVDGLFEGNLLVVVDETDWSQKERTLVAKSGGVPVAKVNPRHESEKGIYPGWELLPPGRWPMLEGLTELEQKQHRAFYWTEDKQLSQWREEKCELVFEEGRATIRNSEGEALAVWDREKEGWVEAPKTEEVLLPVPIDYQDWSLSCESSATQMVLNYLEIPVPMPERFYNWEHYLVSYIPPHQNPHKGFRGDIDQPPSLENYGVYAEPIANLLKGLGFEVEVFYNQGYDWVEKQIRAKYPVVFWRGGRISNGKEPVEMVDDSGDSYKLLLGEHAAVAVGVRGIGEERQFLVKDPIDGQFWTKNFPNWGDFNQMALVVTGYEKPETPEPKPAVEYQTVIPNYFSRFVLSEQDGSVSEDGSSIEVAGRPDASRTHFHGPRILVEGDFDVRLNFAMEPVGSGAVGQISFRNNTDLSVAGEVRFSFEGRELFIEFFNPSDNNYFNRLPCGHLPESGGLRVSFKNAGSADREIITVLDKGGEELYQIETPFKLFPLGSGMSVGLMVNSVVKSMKVENFKIGTIKSQ